MASDSLKRPRDEFRVGMVGLGNMGGRIARHLQSSGYRVLGFDISETRRDESGIEAAESLGQVVRACETVFLSLPDSRIIESVVFGEGGVVENCSRHQVIVDLSTASPESTRAIHDAFQERDVEFLDVGISGGPEAAEHGTLTLMVGGAVDTVERTQPILDVIGNAVFHMGGPTCGHVTKLLNNFLNATSLAATAEVMVAVAKAQLDPKKFLDAVNQSTGVNWATLRRFPTIIEGDYAEGGLTSDLMAKDVRLYLELLRRLGVTSFSGTAVLGVFDLATASGYGGLTSNRVVDVLGDLSGGVRVAAGGTASTKTRRHQKGAANED